MSHYHRAYTIDTDALKQDIRKIACRGRSLLQNETAFFSHVDDALRAADELERKQVQILVIMN